MAVIAVLLSFGAAMAEPYRPASDTDVLQFLPNPSDQTRRELRRLRAELAKDAKNLTVALRLARRYVELGRAESDPRYRGYAEAALHPWWNLGEPPAEVLALRGAIKQSRHDFAGALADLDQVLGRDPRNAQALLTRAVVLRVVGQLRAADESCVRLAPLTPALIGAGCFAAVASLDGRAAAAEETLGRALAAADAKTDPSLRVWALIVRAEIAERRGDAEAAERHFRAALGLGLRDDYLLAAYVDFLLDQGRAADALALLEPAPRTDGLLLRLALAERQVRAPRLTYHVAELAARFDASRARGDALHQREEARFALHLVDRPAQALALALANWAVQREPWDARLVLEAALAADEPQAAGEVLRWMEATRIEDARLRRLARQIGGARS